MDTVIEHILNMESRLIQENKEIKSQLQGLVEINARFAQEIIAIKNGGETKISNGFGGSSDISTEPTPKKSNAVLLEVKGDTLTISGNTYAHRGIFGENGASWNKSDKVWNTNSDKLESISEALKDKGVEFEVK